MTTRDPRSRDPYRPDPPGAGRDPTQSLSLPPDAEDIDDLDAADPAHPSLALGTHGAVRPEHTKIESPAARGKTPLPAAAGRGRPPPIPRPDPDEPERVGSILGSYKVVDLLGKGGMGYVFRAEHVKLGREVALKLLRSDYARRRDAVARFFQEARTVNRVRHRNIVDVTDFVELEDGTTFIIMELLTGQSLGKWARTGIDLPRALAVLVQICDGLGAAHEVGVIHRDLKPDNVIVVPTQDGAELVKLLDFGVAKLVNRDDEDVGFQTAAGSVIGTPAYMSPEQAGGMPVDARSDIYSRGAIMYELFCGQPMFRGRSFGEYVRKHLTEMPVPPSATPNGAQIDPRLDALIMRCLAKDPIQRFANITELRDALFGMLGGMELHLPALASLTGSGLRAMASVSISPLPQLPGLPAHPSSPNLPGSGVHPSQLHYSHGHGQLVTSTGIQTRTPWWVWFVGGALAVGLGIGAAVWYAGRGGLPPAPEAPPVAVKQSLAQPIGADEPGQGSNAINPPAPARVEIKLDSLPSGGVLADGHAAELCRTPCTFEVDPADGGSPDHRTYLVRSEGYRDATIVVDLKGSQRAFQVTLEPREVDIPLDDPDKTAKPDDKTAKPDDKDIRKPPPGKPPRIIKTAKPPRTAKPDDKTAKPDDLDLIDPNDGRPPRKKPGQGPIDPTDTLDPFKPKKSP